METDFNGAVTALLALLARIADAGASIDEVDADEGVIDLKSTPYDLWTMFELADVWRLDGRVAGLRSYDPVDAVDLSAEVGGVTVRLRSSALDVVAGLACVSTGQTFKRDDLLDSDHPRYSREQPREQR
jgi:hypothetical protein